jgi:hypothetical protein
MKLTAEHKARLQAFDPIRYSDANIAKLLVKANEVEKQERDEREGDYSEDAED